MALAAAAGEPNLKKIPDNRVVGEVLVQAHIVEVDGLLHWVIKGLLALYLFSLKDN